MKIGNYNFVFVETICPVAQGKDGGIEYPVHPAKIFEKKNKRHLPLHEYGHLDFCKFRLQNAKEISGVYAWVIQGENHPIYIGEAKKLKTRFNTGYGIISPRNCYKGGQLTNCKMNSVVFNTYKNGQKIDIYFLETKEYKAVEKELLLSIDTPYNVKNNKR